MIRIGSGQVGGAVSSLEILDAYPNTLLGDRERRERYRSTDGTLFFHRHPTLFSYILVYYVQGFIQRPGHIPHELFVEECRFFTIPLDCHEQEKHFILHYADLDIEGTSSRQYLNAIGLAATLLACANLFLHDVSRDEFVYNHHLTPDRRLSFNLLESNSAFTWIELTCTLWFMLEYYLRVSRSQTADRHWEVFIDLTSILPVILSLVANTLSPWLPFIGLVYPLCICLKSFRVLRLTRYSSALNLLRITLSLSLTHVSMPFVLSALFIVPFGVGIYLLERNDPSSTIVDADIGLQWAIDTLTTIGFGTYIPCTYQGRFLSIVGCLFGVILFALPVPMVFRHYEILQQNALKRDLWRTSR